MELRGDYVLLRPMTLRERQLFYRWATSSDATPFWYGELYGDEVPSYVVFKHEWPNYYFDGSQLNKGRAFLIMLDQTRIGQINYNEIEERDHSVELDILIAEEKYYGRGYGTDAIRTLTSYLFREMKVRRCRIEVVSKNPRAIRAYEKAGLKHVYTYSRKGIIWHVMEHINHHFDHQAFKLVHSQRKASSEIHSKNSR